MGHKNQKGNETSRSPAQLLALRRGSAYRKWRGLLTNTQQLVKDLEALGLTAGAGHSHIQFCLAQALIYLASPDDLIRSDLKLKLRKTKDTLNDNS